MTWNRIGNPTYALPSLDAFFCKYICMSAATMTLPADGLMKRINGNIDAVLDCYEEIF